MVTESPTDEIAAEAGALGLLDAIEFVPAELARLPSQLASADVLVNPRTICPGVPMKLLNYMASGAPIVTFDGSSRYLVDGRSGIVVPNEDVRSFAAGILGLLADPANAERVGREAQAFARKSLSWGASAAMIERVYDRVIGSQPRLPSAEPAAPTPR
jgi:glycosyltransferase involved in cell wall biosynthesis